MRLFQSDFDRYTSLVLQQVMNSDSFVSHLTAQKGYLEYKGRKPVAIFFSESGVRNLLANLNIVEIEKAISTFEKENRRLFMIFNVPVFYNPLLEKTEAMVIGDIAWKQMKGTDR